jgi:hypothetical protein
MKELYQEANLELVLFDMEDIIATSSGVVNPTDDGKLDDDELPPVIVP